MRRGAVFAARFVVAALAFAFAACGVPQDDEARTIAEDDVPFGLLDARPPETTTTVVAAPRRPAPVFYVLGDRLAATERELPAPGGVVAALEALVAGPTDVEAARGLRSALPARTFTDVAVRDGVADIDLAAGVADLETAEQVLAVAQIVYTATGSPGVRAVAFRLEGRRAEVPIDGANLVNRPVSRSDYTSVAPGQNS